MRPYFSNRLLPFAVTLGSQLPESHELTDAAIEAVKKIKFTPEQSAGVSALTHGLVECVFRLD